MSTTEPVSRATSTTVRWSAPKSATSPTHAISPRSPPASLKADMSAKIRSVAPWSRATSRRTIRSSPKPATAHTICESASAKTKSPSVAEPSLRAT